MEGKTARRLQLWRKADIWIALEYRVWWWTVGFIALVVLGGACPP